MNNRTEVEQLTGADIMAAPRENEAAATEEEKIKAVAARMLEKCRMAQKDNNFSQKFHKLIIDPNFIKLRGYYEKNNIFSIVGRTQQENWHSSFLAWLLNPKGSHGLGYFPLRCLLAQAGASARRQPEFMFKKDLPGDSLIETGEFSDAVVRPKSIGQSEYPEKHVRYHGDAGERRYDQDIGFDIALSAILTEPSPDPTQGNIRHKLVLICENKIESHEGKAQKNKDTNNVAGNKDNTPSQTEMYADFWYGKKAFYPMDADLSAYKDQDADSDPQYPALCFSDAEKPYRIMLFLAANGDKAKDSKRFINIDYNDLYESTLLPSLVNPNISADAKRYLQEYVDVLDLKGYITSRERKDLLKNIYRNHSEVLFQHISCKFFLMLFDGFLQEREEPCRSLTERISMLFPDRGFDGKKFKKRFKDYRSNIIHWLYYFTDIDNFRIKKEKESIAATPKSDFSSTTVEWDTNITSDSGTDAVKYDISCWSGGEEICDYDNFAKAATAVVESVFDLNRRIFDYISGVDGKYREILDYLIKNFKGDQKVRLPKNFKDDQKVRERPDPLKSIVALLTQNKKANNDFSYLEGKLLRGPGEDYPVLYHKYDTDQDHPIYINIGKQPSFIFKKPEDRDSEKWRTGNQICQDIAKMFKRTTESNQYQWVQFLRTKGGKPITAL